MHRYKSFSFFFFAAASNLASKVTGQQHPGGDHRTGSMKRLDLVYLFTVRPRDKHVQYSSKAGTFREVCLYRGSTVDL